MGDRCYMRITVAREYAHLFKNLFLEETEESEPIAELFDEEANYAYGVSLGESGHGDLPKGVPFYGYHDSGGGYSGGLFATLGDVMEFVEMNNEGETVVRVRENGEVDAEDLAQVKAYFATRNAVMEQHKKLTQQ